MPNTALHRRRFVLHANFLASARLGKNLSPRTSEDSPSTENEDLRCRCRIRDEIVREISLLAAAETGFARDSPRERCSENFSAGTK